MKNAPTPAPEFHLEGNFGRQDQLAELAELELRRKQREAIARRQAAPLCGANDLDQTGLFHEDHHLFNR